MRYRSLDGLRGLAALVVLIHHALLTLPAFSEAFWRRAPLEGALALLDGTPLHLIWAGPEAVYVFFVLSGLVLGIAAKSPHFEWMPYYPSRLLRLYLPVVAAVVLCAPLLIWAAPIPRDASAWVRAHPSSYGLGKMLSDTTLIGGISGGITPLWSLQWEVVFSLLLPVYIVAVRRRQLWWEVPVLLGLAALGAYKGSPVLNYLPMFALGIAMSSAWDDLERWLADRRTMAAVVLWGLALVIGVMMMMSSWILVGWGADPPDWLLLPLKLLGVCIIVLGAAFAPGMTTVLGSRAGVFLGAVSFSLYLVHEPVLMFFARLVPDPMLALAFSLPAICILTLVFWKVVEQQAHRLSRLLRDRLATPADAITPAPATKSVEGERPIRS